MNVAQDHPRAHHRHAVLYILYKGFVPKVLYKTAILAPHVGFQRCQ